MNLSSPQLQWCVAAEDRARTAELSRHLNIPRLAAHLLLLRGIQTPDQAQRFLSPSVDHLSDPFSLTGMTEAVARLTQARDRGERVLVFGDYDVDGIVGTAILLSGLRRFGIQRCEPGLPSRLLEGYGLAPEQVQAAYEAGVRLIVTVDNGINAREAADRACSLGVDLIITDHHQIEGDLPEAVSIVNPKQEGPNFAAADLSGAAVAFKLAQALTGTIADLDLVALGTVADIVPLQGENRALVSLGMAEMIRAPRTGLRALCSVAGINLPELTAEQIAFQIAPRINAAARLGDSMMPFELLTTDNPSEATRMAEHLNQANDRRKEIENEILEQAVAMIESGPAEVSSLILAGSQWHPGVIGIVASRLVNRYHRPVALVAFDEDGVGRASARSCVGRMPGALDPVWRSYGGRRIYYDLRVSAAIPGSL